MVARAVLLVVVAQAAGFVYCIIIGHVNWVIIVVYIVYVVDIVYVVNVIYVVLIIYMIMLIDKIGVI